MKKEYLIINDEIVLKKLEELFWFDEANIYSKIDLNLIKEYCNLSKKGKRKNTVEDYCNNVSVLRGFLLNEIPSKVSLDELEKYIDIFLFLLRNDVQEASFCFDRFLDVVLANVSTLYKEKCFKRLTCVLYVIYKSRFYKEEPTNELSDYTFSNNIKSLSEEDKNYIIDIFIEEKNYNGLIEVIESYYVWNKAKEELPTIDSVKAMDRKFKYIFRKINNVIEYGGSNDGEVYSYLETIKKSNFTRILKKLVPKLSDNIDDLFLLFSVLTGNTGKSLNENTVDLIIQDNRYSRFLYIIAKFLKKESRKENENQSEEYLKKAIYCIEKAGNTEHYWLGCNELLLEKSEILAEMGEYEQAYGVMISVINNSDIKTEKWFHNPYYRTLIIWISSQYLRVKKSYEDYNRKEIIAKMDDYVKDNFYNLKEFEPIVKFANENVLLKDLGIRDDVYVNMLIMMGCADLILRKSRIWDVSRYNVVYYTRANSLKLLLKDEGEDVKYRLPLFHANHMNDPEEGKVFKKFLDKNFECSNSSNDCTSIREIYEENYVFLKSFFISEKDRFNEFLPMWVQYGDDAKGVCVRLNESTFDKLELYRINYLNDSGSCENDSEINKLLSDYKNAYEDILTICNDISEDKFELKEEILYLLEYINSRIVYLFKHDSYKHENEARILVTKTNTDADLDKVKTISGEIPKLFMYSDYQTYIDEIILGSKMDNADDFVPFVHYHGRKMWKNNDKKRQITVSKSSIKYR